MEAEAHDASPDSPARLLLTKQDALIEAQLRSENLGAALKVLTGAAGLAVAVVFAWMAWTAHQDRSLAINAFQTPPDLEQRGLGGAVLAARMRDLLRRMQQETRNFDSAVSVRNAVDDGVKVEIPTTGVSLADLQRLLREVFGRQTPVTAEVFRPLDASAPLVLGLNVRVGAAPGVRLVQPDGDVDALVQRAGRARLPQRCVRTFLPMA